MSTSVDYPAARLPGDLAMWLFILAELTVFALLILTFIVAQVLSGSQFAASRALLDGSIGLALTLSLLTAGLFAALAVQRTRAGEGRKAAPLLLAALASGCVYVVLKGGEYAHLIEMGLDLEYDRFFTLYWILGGFHFLHVLPGLLLFAWLALRCRRGVYDAPERRSELESCVLYWHMVDLIWVLLLPLLYLQR
ncbi:MULTISPECIES: cytochrome c oxidase subunit 3 [unclassified Pseudomonas]|uniref:cytochrome c oxidase subunit 3 n=1 Tax=unclassified Pseudomonas TaxID=196821 RepID=UPI00244C57D6|nr:MULTISPECIES: cytochrome c oxidase subunit 3 [unclassified Pseudomonas]MDH0896527.1 cytochrome c oxidase subunit 3 [Pseudomonas sp. GD03875]MDH1065455.1 cytochrome c oxidase subunit 3 [Pseudomonas sp. GD03985]